MNKRITNMMLLISCNNDELEGECMPEGPSWPCTFAREPRIDGCYA